MKKIGMFVITLMLSIIALTSCGTNTTKFTVTFDANGGKFSDGKTTIEVKVEKNATLNKVEDPTRSGYTFVNWYKEKGLANSWNFTKDTVDGDITLYAKWNAVQGESYTSETYNWTTPETDALKLTADYAGKTFEKDGIGIVTPVRYVDGDTTMFKSDNGEAFTVRYNGINTPESTYRIEPWGFAASQYNKTKFKEALEKGAKVVLEAEKAGETDSNGRYLAWVWLVYPDGDSRLLNLELAELAYAQVKSASGTKYESNLNRAIADILKYGLRVYGEKDSSYDYSKTAKQMTIKEIKEEFGTAEKIDSAEDGYMSPLVEVTGVVVKNDGKTNAYIQQYDEDTNTYYGIYVYGGYNNISKLVVGAKVAVTAKIGYYFGALQITDLTTNNKIRVLTYNAFDEIYAVEETLDSVNDIYAYEKIGNLVQINNCELKVTGYNDGANNSAMTIYCEYKDANGKTQRLNIRISQNVALYDPETGEQIISGSYFVGKTFTSLTCVVAYYNGANDWPGKAYANGHIQLAIFSMDDVKFAE